MQRILLCAVPIYPKMSSKNEEMRRKMAMLSLCINLLSMHASLSGIDVCARQQSMHIFTQHTFSYHIFITFCLVYIIYGYYLDLRDSFAFCRKGCKCCRHNFFFCITVYCTICHLYLWCGVVFYLW